MSFQTAGDRRMPAACAAALQYHLGELPSAHGVRRHLSIDRLVRDDARHLAPFIQLGAERTTVAEAA